MSDLKSRAIHRALRQRIYDAGDIPVREALPERDGLVEILR